MWKDKWNIHKLTNMHYPPLEGNFCDKQGKAVKPAIIQDTWDMWTNLTAWWTLTLLADRLGNGQRNYSSIFWTLQFSTVLSFSPLVVQNVHSDKSDSNGWGTSYKRWEGCLTSDHKTKKTRLIQEPTKKTWLESQQTLAHAA